MSTTPPLRTNSDSTPPLSPEHKSLARSHSFYNALGGVASSPSGISSGAEEPSPDLAPARRFCGALDCFLPRCLVDLFESFCCWIASFCVTPPKSIKEELDNVIRKQGVWMERQRAPEMTMTVTIKLLTNNGTRERAYTHSYNASAAGFRQHVQEFITYNLDKLKGASIHGFSLEFVTLLGPIESAEAGYVHTHTYDSALSDPENTHTEMLDPQELTIKKAEVLDGLNRAQIVTVFTNHENFWDKKNGSTTDPKRVVKIHIRLISQEDKEPFVFSANYAYSFSKRADFNDDMRSVIEMVGACKAAPFKSFKVEIVELYHLADETVMGYGYQYALNQPLIETSFASHDEFAGKGFELQLEETAFQHDQGITWEE